MECQCKVDQRRLIPGVFNLKQYLNNTETMVWTLDSMTANDGECDLCAYDVFLVLSNGDMIDEIQISKQIEDNILKLVWNVGSYATMLSGYVHYQIVFRSPLVDSLGVICADDENANGIYEINSVTVGDKGRIFTNSDSGYTIKWCAENKCWAIYDANGEMVYCQTISNEEPCGGAWGDLLVGNHTASVWESDEAIMFISDSISADQSVTANFPTILRQMWLNLRNMAFRTGSSVMQGTIAADAWRGEEAPYYFNLTEALNIESGLGMSGFALFQAQENGDYDSVANFRLSYADGMNIVYSNEKINGRFVATVGGVYSNSSTEGGISYLEGAGISINGDIISVNFSQVASKDHAHTQYVLQGHTHTANDVNGLANVATTGSYADLSNKPKINGQELTGDIIIDVGSGGGVTYTAGDGITITGNVLSVDYAKVAAKEHTHSKDDITDLIEYSAGSGISISDDGVISATGSGGTGTVYQAGDGIKISGETVSVDFSEVAAADHTHDYALSTHNHEISEINELELRFSRKSDSWHTHTEYAASSHTHAKSDITDLIEYTAGDNITIDAEGKISATDTKYTAGEGLTLTETSFTVDTEVIASREYVEGLVGDINTVLDAINQEMLELNGGLE